MTPEPLSMRGETEHPVVLFDGVCNMCNAWVTFVIDRDPRGVFRFASLQSDVAHRLLEGVGRPVPQGDPDSIVVVEGANVYDASTAVLRVMQSLNAPWPALAVFRLVPRPLRDAIYRWAASHRYEWFGKSETCRVPTPAERGRFLPT